MAELVARCGLPDSDVTSVRRAGFLHGLGRTGIPNGIWEKAEPLTEGEWERVRLYPYLTERILAYPAGLARLDALAALHHERLDGEAAEAVLGSTGRRRRECSGPPLQLVEQIGPELFVLRFSLWSCWPGSLREA